MEVEGRTALVRMCRRTEYPSSDPDVQDKEEQGAAGLDLVHGAFIAPPLPAFPTRGDPQNQMPWLHKPNLASGPEIEHPCFNA